VFGALSAEDGRVLWERRHPYRPDDFQVPFSGVFRPDIVVDPRGRPVLGYGNSLIAFDHDGRIRWTKDMPDRRNVSSQTMAMGSDGRLYVASLSDKHLIRAFDSQGNQLFKTSLPDGWTYPQLLAIGKDGMLIVEALKVEEDGDQWEIQSRIFALGDRGSQ
jgi:outer membrane protein assembly factor BamB